MNSTATTSIGNYDLNITQTTEYPYSGDIKVNVAFTDNGKGDATMQDLRIRIPGWAVNKPVDSDLYSYVNPKTQPIVIKVAGQEYTYKVENGFAILPIDEVKKGEVEVILPMDVHQVVSNENLKSNKGLRSYERGPLVYCAEGVDNGNNLDHLYIPENVEYTTKNILPALLNGGTEQILAPAVNVQNSNGEVIKSDTIVRMLPYFARAHRTPSQMKVWIAMDESTLESSLEYIDKVQPCDAAGETAHNLAGTNMRTGADLGWRDSDGGYISYVMAVDPNRPVDLILKQWGSDSNNRKFDIYVDGRKFSYDEIENFAPNQYYYMHHAIPFELTSGKSKVTIKLQSINGSTVGGIFGVYTSITENVPANTVPMDNMWTYVASNLSNHNYVSNGESGIFRNHRWMDGRGIEGQKWTMKVNPTNRNYLMVCYWGGEWDSRDFDIYCDDTFVATEHLINNDPGRFFFRTYIIPEEGTSNKSQVTIHLTSPSGTKTGGIYYSYMMSEPLTNNITSLVGNDVDNSRFFTLTGLETEKPQQGLSIIQKEGNTKKMLVNN